jgi:hypothetical protein
MNLRPVCLALLLFTLAVPASAEVEKFMRPSGSSLQPYFRMKFTPPVGWVQDDDATKENDMAIYVPAGEDFSSAPALIYIRVSYNSDQRSLARFIEVAHERWKAAVRDSKIEKRPSEKRANGQPGFQVYHFTNPSDPQQAFEMMAYGEDKDKDGNAFFLMIALTGSSQKALAAAEAAYRASLRTH